MKLPAAISFALVSHRYGANASVHEVSLEVFAGEIVCLLGPSGCGKTTLLRLASGLEVPEGGEIRMQGNLVAGDGYCLAPERRATALVFQDYALFPHLTVIENVRFGLRHLAMPDRMPRAMETLERLGVAHLAGRYPHMLSGGQQQRVALARALATRPRVMLMDEAFSGLDTTLRQRIREETRQILKQQATATLLVTHDPEEAAQLGDRILLLKGGRVEQAGTPDDLFFKPATAFAATFFGHATQFTARLQGQTVSTAFATWELPPADPLVQRGEGTLCCIVRHQAVQLFAHGTRLPADLHPIQFAVEVLDSRLVNGQRQTRVAASGPDCAGRSVQLECLGDVRQRPQHGKRYLASLDPRLVFLFSF